MLPTRRKFGYACVAGVMTLGGCIGFSGSDDQNVGASADSDDDSGYTPTERPDADGDGVPDLQDEFPNDPEYSVEEEVINVNKTINEDHWYSWDFDITTTTRFEYDFIVRSGPAIDFYTMTQSEYRSFEEGERGRYHSDLSDPDSAGGQGEGELPPGNYVMVLDNSDKGNASPPTNFDEDPVQVEFRVVASK